MLVGDNSTLCQRAIDAGFIHTSKKKIQVVRASGRLTFATRSEAACGGFFSVRHEISVPQ